MNIVNQDVTKLNPGGLGVWMKQVPLVNKTICDFLGGSNKKEWSIRPREELVRRICKYIRHRLRARAKYGLDAEFERYAIDLCWHPKELANKCIHKEFGKKVKAKEKDFIHACFHKLNNSLFFQKWCKKYLEAKCRKRFQL